MIYCDFLYIIQNGSCVPAWISREGGIPVYLQCTLECTISSLYMYMYLHSSPHSLLYMYSFLKSKLTFHSETRPCFILNIQIATCYCLTPLISWSLQWLRWEPMAVLHNHFLDVPWVRLHREAQKECNPYISIGLLEVTCSWISLVLGVKFKVLNMLFQQCNISIWALIFKW